MFWRKQRIYMDAAAATPLDPHVRERFVEALSFYGNPGALHAEGASAKALLEEARAEAASAIGAHDDEVVFTGSGTESNNLAIAGVLEHFFAEGIHAITTSIEHPSVLEPLRAFEARASRVTYIPPAHDGIVDPEAISSAITEQTVLVSVGLVNSEIGVVQDVRAIAKQLRAQRKKRGASGMPLYLHVDAAQAPLWLPIKVDELHADLLTLDAQKVGGPKGSGLLYVRRGVPLVPQMRGGGQERGLRSGTEHAAIAAALARALSLAQKTCVTRAARVAAIRDAFFDQLLSELPGTIVNGSRTMRVANNVHVSMPGLIGERAVLALSAWGVSAATRSACAATDEELSHVILALASGEDANSRARTAIRFTLLPDVTSDQVKRAVALLKKAAAEFSNIDA